MLKYIFIFFCFTFFYAVSFTQITDLKDLPDSLKAQVDTIDIAENKSNFLMRKSWEFIPDQLDLAYLIIKHSEKIARDGGYLKGIANAQTTLGAIFQLQSDFPKALEYQFDALKIYKNNDDPDFKKSLGSAYNNIGNTYILAENVEEALKYYKLSFEQRDQYNDTAGVINTLLNMVSIHLMEEEFETAVEKSYTIIDSMNHYNTERQPNLFGDSDYYNAYSNIMESFNNLDQHDSTLVYFQKILQHMDTTKNYARIVNVFLDGAIAFKSVQQDDKAKYYLDKGLSKISSGQVNYSLKNKSDFSSKLYEYYKIKGDYKKALSYFEEHFNHQKEQLNKEKNEKIASFTNQIKFKEKENELKLLAAENKLKTEQVAAANQVRNAFIAMAVVIILASIILFKKFKVTKKLNRKISVKNREIVDSIDYAKRIQRAVLPTYSHLNKIFKEIFVFYQPKDVVAGDFYWVYQKEKTTYLAVADCTGHGVPGAMVSVIANSALNRSVKEFNLERPADILDKTRSIIIQEFEKSEEDVKDGMDIALTAIFEDKIIFSGANNPLWVVRDGQYSEEDLSLRTKDKYSFDSTTQKTLIDLAPDKQPIGKYEHQQVFSEHTIDRQAGDRIFLFSDGFQDQFGGQKDKKYKRSRFRQFIIDHSEQSIGEFNELLIKEFSDWKSDKDQVDDVCVVGVQL